MNKKNKVILLAGMVLAGAGFTSCNKFKDFGNVNQNPGITTSPITSALLTNVESGLGNYTWDAGGITTLSGLYCQYYSETQYTDASCYSRQQPNWDGYYAGRLMDLQTIINYNSDPATAAAAAASGANANQIAIARILKVYIFALLTDSYGDIPYFQALKLDNGIVPFDKQSEIYPDFFKELSEAVNQLDDAGQAMSGDIIYNGDNTMWRKFANSLHAMLALRLSKVDAGQGKSEFNNALNGKDGVFGTGETAQLDYPDGNFPNPVYNYYNVTLRKDYAVSKFFLDGLLSNNDKRADVWASSTVGFPYGLTRDNAIAFSNANPTWARLFQGTATSVNDPFYILTSGEVFLARAEAAQMGWTGENASSLYQSGIQDSWTLNGVYNASDFNAYMALPNISLAGGDEIKKIATQEWITHYPNGRRGWADWRRTGYPALTPAPGATNSYGIPRRMAYGQNTLTLNPDNAAAASAIFTGPDGANSQYARMWWDKN
ncbi:MAG: SusD/RagB family nutrient-binding outer membrane lipoprotein [Bacteroidetes bacterium]|nr:SusD/RagB family nutrient-binding outer membrane lipoprotein [Bacteroidota bacterium]